MSIPKAVARFNKRVTNPVMRHVAAHLPWCAVVTHIGRQSGRRYHTPVNVFRRGDDFVFVMTYGRDADWVRNVDAAGSCDVVTGGRNVRLVEPASLHRSGPSRRSDVRSSRAPRDQRRRLHVDARQDAPLIRGSQR